MAIPLYEQANKLNEEGKFEEALDLYDQLLTQNPDHPILLAAVATILMRNTKTLGMAIALFRKSLDNAKGKAATEVYSNLGLAYKYSGQPALALEYMKKAIDTEPTAGTLTNYGSMFVESDRPEEGKKHLERAISMEPTLALAHWNLSLCLLSTAHATDGWARAWEEYEYGQHEGGMRVVKKHVALPEWDGTPGKKVLIYGEQGIGDEIMFASMLPDAMRDCREVILDCHPRLVSLFEKNFGVKCYGTRKEPGAEWLAAEKPDAMIAIGSLGKFYRRTRASFPGTSYLKADPVPKGDKFRVGISWTGGRLSGRIAKRTVPLNWWRSILDVPGVEFVSLQYTDGSQDEIDSVNRLGYKITEPPQAKAKDYRRPRSLSPPAISSSRYARRSSTSPARLACRAGSWCRSTRHGAIRPPA
jgi:tetratricopeptide (TPR) repeat protein